MASSKAAITGFLILLGTRMAFGSPLTFIDDYEGFVEAAPGEVRSIDFETLPDGSPSWVPAQITPRFQLHAVGRNVSAAS